MDPRPAPATGQSTPQSLGISSFLATSAQLGVWTFQLGIWICQLCVWICQLRVCLDLSVLCLDLSVGCVDLLVRCQFKFQVPGQFSCERSLLALGDNIE